MSFWLQITPPVNEIITDYQIKQAFHTDKTEGPFITQHAFITSAGLREKDGRGESAALQSMTTEN